jgi:hypothetical protein
MEAMEGGTLLVYTVEAGHRRLAIGTRAAELETVTAFKAFPPGHVARLVAPISRFWPDGTPVGVIVTPN